MYKDRISQIHFLLGACSFLYLFLSIIIQADASPQVRIIASPTIVRGWEVPLQIEIVDGFSVDTNWYGTLKLYPEKDAVVSDGSVDIVKGRSLENPTLKSLSSLKYTILEIVDPTGRSANCSYSYFTYDPEKEGNGFLYNEIMYSTDHDRSQEWFEIYNHSGQDVSLEGIDIVVSDVSTTSRSYCCLLDDATVTWFENKKVLAAGGFLLVVRDLSVFSTLYPDVIKGIKNSEEGFEKTVLVEVRNKSDAYNMPNTGGTLYLRKGTGLEDTLLTLVCYDSSWGGSKNVSLERRSVFLPGNDRMNWASATRQGGTPGSENSISIPEKKEGNIGISLFSDIARKKDGRFTVRIDAENEISSVKVALCGINGNEIYVFGESLTLSPGMPVVCELDFLKDNNRTVPVGICFIKVQGKGKDGKSVKALKRIVVAE